MTRFGTIGTLAIAAMAVAACTTTKGKAPEADGAWRPLNAAHWQATRDDLRGPRAPLPPSQSWNVQQKQGRL